MGITSWGGSRYELGLRLLSIPRTLLVYLSILFFPHDLHYYRSQDILASYMGPLIGLVGVTALVFFLIRQTSARYKKLVLFGLGWFGISLFPTLNIVPLINEYSLILTAEHFLYLPVIGFLIFVFGIVCDWAEKQDLKNRSEWSLALVIVLSVVCIVTTVRQNTFWRGEIPLFQRTLQFEKSFGRGHILLAKAYYFHHQFDTAIEENLKALSIMQGYANKTENQKARQFYLNFVKEIRFDLGRCFEAKGNFEAALNEYQEALEIDPADSSICNNVGLIHLKSNHFDEAIQYFEKALILNPDNLLAMNNLAICYLETDERVKAEKVLRDIVKRNPQFTPAVNNLKTLILQNESISSD